MKAHTPGHGWELNGLRFAGPGLHGDTETFHADDFPVYGAASDMLTALEAIIAAEEMPVDLKDYASNGAYFAAYAEALALARAAISKASTPNQKEG